MNVKKNIAKRAAKRIARTAIDRIVNRRNNYVELEVIDTPLCTEYLDEIKENDKCTIPCNYYADDGELMAQFSASATARKRGIDNDIPEESKPIVRAFHKDITLEICEATGWSYKYNSGHRSEELNTAVGGSPTSEHRTLNGRVAGDLRFFYPSGKQVPVLKVARKVLELGLRFGQMILYGTFLHLSYRLLSENPREVRRHSSYTGEMP